LWPTTPKFSNCRRASYEELLPEGLTMGTLSIGRQGTGKTSSLARHLVEYFKAYPDRAIFVLDWSGSITDTILSIISREATWERLSSRIIYDELGNPEWVVPMPEFSQLYGSTYEEQVQRVSQNLTKLAPELVRDAPFLTGLGFREIAPQLFRLLTAVSEDSKSWQVTEAKRLLNDKVLMEGVLRKYGNRVPEAKWFFENIFLNLKYAERDLRTYALTAMLGAIEPAEARARVGSYRPGWTPREAIKEGMMVIVNGARLIKQRNTQHYLFTQIYSLIMSELNKRTPGDPKDKPVALVMDEVYSLLSIPGMAEEVGTLSPLYRSRKLELYVVLQALSQLAITIKEQIWSIGNIVCFGISNFDEAYKIAQQMFPYDPQTVKLSPKTDTGQPVTEPDRGQYLQMANQIQRLAHRECIVRRYVSESALDRHIWWVERTKDIASAASFISPAELKELLLRKRAVKVSEALAEINRRSLTTEKVSRPEI
jgi:hypothetical protein